jgi:hypothetical protein
MDQLTRIVDEADAAGYSLVPVGKDSKVSLTRWNVLEFCRREILDHVHRGGNVAAKVGPTRDGTQVIVIDRDARDLETWRFLQEHGLHRSNMQVLTAAGNWHLWFRLTEAAEEMRTKIKLLVEGRKLPVDVKATGYVLLPPSRIDSGEYRFRREKLGLKRPEELQPLPDSMLRLIRREPVAARPALSRLRGVSRGEIKNPEAYVLRVESHQGSNGSAGLVRAVCVMRDAGRSAQQTLDYLLSVWNQPPRVTPAWSVQEIEHAIKRLFK